MTLIIIILSLLTTILSYVSYNLLKKNEACEDIIKSYEKHMIDLSNTIEFSDKKLKEIDAKGSFEGDDEVGFFFKTLKFLQDELNNFQISK
jgi:hypothetical protein